MNHVLQAIHTGNNPDEAAIIFSENKTQHLLKLKEKDVVEKVITANNDRQDLIYVYGVPKRVHRINHEGQTVYRHYTTDSLNEILASKSLKTGPRPFIDPTPHARWEYQDMTGIMFTEPKFDPKELWMNVNEKSDWVEFTLDPRVPVLFCKEGNYLIPLQKNYPDWMRKDYEKYLETGASAYKLEDEWAKLKATGGMLPRQEIHIQLTSYQKDGVIYQGK